MKYLLFVTAIILVFQTNVFAQKNKKMQEKYAYAKRCYINGDTQQSLKILKELCVEDSTYTEPYSLLAEIYFQNEKFDLLTALYERMTRTCGKTYPNSYMLLGNCYMYLGEVQKAKTSFEDFLKQKNIKQELVKLAKDNILRCDFSINLVNNPVPFNPQNMGDSVNSYCDEYYPYLSPDEQTLVITRKVPIYKNADPSSDNTQEDFYISEWNGTSWSKAKELPGTVNTRNNEGAQTISGDGQYMVLTACNRGDGIGECDLYYSKKINGKWTSPTNMSYIVNSPNWDSQPSLSADGQSLFFASSRAGGFGQSDIWLSTRNEYGKWRKPVPLDTTINTSAAETSPFIHPDGRTLYFCSNGHMGVGGFDIFYSKMDEDGKWSKPKNLGYPINTSKDEIGLIVNAKGDKAYITSSREGGVGLQDIYTFELYKDARPTAVTYVKGRVMDMESGLPLKADFELKDVETGKTIVKSTSDEHDGSFLITLVPGKDYGLFVTSEGSLFYSENINLTTPTSSYKPVVIDIPLAKISAGQKMILKNIFFDTDSSNIKPSSESELQKLISFMNSNPKIKIEISGHTDNVGKPSYNLDLSLRRAKAVYNYLISKGIVSTKLTYKGYGETQPVAKNETEEGRAQNRRTEMKIVE